MRERGRMRLLLRLRLLSFTGESKVSFFPSFFFVFPMLVFYTSFAPV